MADVTIANYGLGNVLAFAHIYERLNLSFEIATEPQELKKARRIVLPGVGAFDWAMTRLNESGLRDTLDDLVQRRQVPVLGVCVGMQMMAIGSEEGELPGLGWLDARVVRFSTEDAGDVPLPHMGWNDVRPVSNDGVFADIDAPRFYFLHSYYIRPSKEQDILATARYGKVFAAAVRDGHIVGTQFHPEKSHQWGIDLLRNFAAL